MLTRMTEAGLDLTQIKTSRPTLCSIFICIKKNNIHSARTHARGHACTHATKAS